jgi:hypothetical protein
VTWILLNIPLAVVMMTLTVGLPLWIILRYPEEDRIVDVPREVLRRRPSAHRPAAPRGIRVLAPARS